MEFDLAELQNRKIKAVHYDTFVHIRALSNLYHHKTGFVFEQFFLEGYRQD